jgi:hypothetical protein
MPDAAVADAPVTTTTAGTAAPAAVAAVAAVAPAAAVKPTDIKYDLKAPKDSTLDSAWLDKTAAFARERGLSPEQAQAIVDRDALSMTYHAEQQGTAVKAVIDGWAAEAKADKEIGGEAFGKNAELAKRVIDKYGSDTFKKSLDETGFSNNPELLRLLVRIGKQMGEDSFVLPRSQPQSTGKSMAEVLYGEKK